MLSQRGGFHELPAVEYGKGPDYDKVARLWDKSEYDCCCLIGQEAARIYLQQCKINYEKIDNGHLLPTQKSMEKTAGVIDTLIYIK